MSKLNNYNKTVMGRSIQISVVTISTLVLTPSVFLYYVQFVTSNSSACKHARANTTLLHVTLSPPLCCVFVVFLFLQCCQVTHQRRADMSESESMMAERKLFYCQKATHYCGNSSSLYKHMKKSFLLL